MPYHFLTYCFHQSRLYRRFLKTLSISTLSASLSLCLCACSTTSETFDCKAGKGVGCKSISEVNQMVDDARVGQGALEQARLGQVHLGKCEERGMQSKLPPSHSFITADSFGVEAHEVESSGNEALHQQTEASLADVLTVHRVQEEHLKVWIAPFQDEWGNLHEPRKSS